MFKMIVLRCPHFIVLARIKFVSSGIRLTLTALLDIMNLLMTTCREIKTEI